MINNTLDICKGCLEAELVDSQKYCSSCAEEQKEGTM